MVRICPGCDVRLDHVRCGRCFSLQVPGDFACGRCRQPLELEPLLDATDAPCPRCRSPLEAAAKGTVDTGRMHECPRCGGLFVGREALDEILARAEVAGAFGARESAGASSSIAPVTYVSCPLCHATMNRVNFGRVSGVIVDVCREHGTWFDPGELTRVVAFASAGGMAKVRRRVEEDARAAHAANARAVVALRGEAPANAEDDVVRELVEGFFWWL